MSQERPRDGSVRPLTPPGVSEDSRSETQVDGPGRGDADIDLRIDGYTVLGKLHQGGQGVVFKALQHSTKREVAVKVLREGPYAAEMARRRFQREVEIVAGLRHPNLVAIFDSGTTSDGHAFYVMEYVPGLEFDRHVRENRLSLEETLLLFRDVLEGVQYAHEQGVIHRDLKPSNILVDGEGRPKVLDFGLARGLATPADTVASVTGQLLGTVSYMSPEQVRGNSQEIDARSDVYSLGVILYEIVTGEYPYPVKGTLVESLHNITAMPPRAPASAWNASRGIGRRHARETSLRCPVDGDLETILLTALAKDRDRRYPTVRDLAEDISRTLDGRPIAAKRDSGWYVLRKRMRRNRRAGMIALAGAAAAVALLYALGQFSPGGGAPAGGGVRPINAEAEAAFQGQLTEYEVIRRELVQIVESRIESGDLVVSPLTQESLQVIRDAIDQLRGSLEKDPGNPELQNLLLTTHQREIGLLRRIATSAGKV